MVTGNTSAWRGKPNFCMFAPTKAAQRILAEAIARDLGPKGVHVAYITIDAAIDTPFTRPRLYPDKPDDFFAKPSAIADTIYHVAHQDPSAWLFNVEAEAGEGVGRGNIGVAGGFLSKYLPGATSNLKKAACLMAVNL